MLGPCHSRASELGGADRVRGGVTGMKGNDRRQGVWDRGMKEGATMTVMLALLLAGAHAAEPPAKPKPIPTPKELGAEMMRSAFESVGGLDPQVQPFVLFYVGRAM